MNETQDTMIVSPNDARSIPDETTGAMPLLFITVLTIGLLAAAAQARTPAALALISLGLLLATILVAGFLATTTR